MEPSYSHRDRRCPEGVAPVLAEMFSECLSALMTIGTPVWGSARQKGAGRPSRVQTLALTPRPAPNIPKAPKTTFGFSAAPPDPGGDSEVTLSGWARGRGKPLASSSPGPEGLGVPSTPSHLRLEFRPSTERAMLKPTEVGSGAALEVRDCNAHVNAKDGSFLQCQ